METLRKLVPWNNEGDRDRPSWRQMCKTWYNMVFSYRIRDCDPSSLDYKEWNPWKDWCQSWEQFQSSQEMPPKSEKRKATMFAELSPIAKLTRDRLEEAKNHLEQKTKVNECLRNQNYILNKKCEELQQQLEAAKQIIVENNRNLEKEVNLKRSLEAQNAFLTFQAEKVKQEADNDLEQETKVNDSLKKQNYILNKKCEELQQKIAENNRILEKELSLKRCLEAQISFLTFQADQQEEKVCKLEEKVSSLQSQLVESNRDIRCQINIKNDTFFFHNKNGECQNMLDRDTIREIVDRLGEVNDRNVFDWLCKFEEYKIWNFNSSDFEQILRWCMDRSSFASLPTIVKRNQVSWIDICVRIASEFIPDLDNSMDTEQMRDNDNVLQYFQRMWMIYRITEYSDVVSKDDPKYKKAIFLGLRPHLYKEVDYLWDEDDEYEDILHAVLLAEDSWLKSEKWRMKTRKARAGCPSRKTIWWKLLRKYHVPYVKINDAPYWDLVVCLSKYEDLETEEPL